MRLSWISLWLLLVFAVLGEPLLYFDEKAPAGFPWPFLAGALALYALDGILRKHEEPEGSSSEMALLAPLVLGLLASPTGRIRVGFGILLAAVLAGRLLPKWGGRIARAVRPAGKALLAFGVLQWLLPQVLARHHELPFLNGPAAALLRLAGVEAGAGAESFSIQKTGSFTPFAISMEKLAIGPAILLLAGAFWILGRRARRLRTAAVLMGSWAGFLFLRAVVLSALVADGLEMRIFYEPWPVLSSLGPIVLLWALLFRKEGGPTPVAASAPSKPLVPSLAAVVLAAWVWAAWSEDPGIRKAGRILVDETHSEWERSDDPLTREKYGNITTYNYYSLVEFVRSYFPAVDRNYEILTPEILENYDVLILKTPTLLYQPEEVRAVRDFVASGGGVWMIGDHTDVFGTSTCLNQIGRELGMQFAIDSADDLVKHEKQIYRPPDAGAHPIVRWMPDTLLATSCSLEVGHDAAAAMIGNTMFADRPIYTKINFLGDAKVDGVEPFGMFVQAAGSRFGGGRVAAFTDSTSLSNFTFFFPGKWEMTVSTVEWLNRRNGNVLHDSARWGLLLTGAVLLGLLAHRFGWREAFRLEAVASGLWCGLFVSDALTAAAYPLPKPISRYPIVAFEREYGRYRLPLEHETHYWDTDNYQTLFVWNQRIGLVPRVFSRMQEALENDALVLVRPRKAFSPAAVTRIREFVEQGGALFVLDELDLPGSTAASVLETFSLRLGQPLKSAKADLSGIGPFSAGSTLELPSATTVQGGDPFLKTVEGVPLGASKAWGKGKVAALGLARAYAVDRYGSVQGKPQESQIALAEIQYHVLEKVLGLKSLPPAGTTRNVGQPKPPSAGTDSASKGADPELRDDPEAEHPKDHR